MHVALDLLPLSTHDQRHLGVGLESNNAIDDVNPDLLERLRPGDVRLFVATRFELDQSHDLLTALSRPDERSDDGAHRTRGPVERLLDREDVGIPGRLVDERLSGGGKGVVRMVHEDVAVIERVENVGLLHAGTLKSALRDWGPQLVLEVGTIEGIDRPQAAQVEQAVDAVDIGGL